jgi:hypothetical protein
MVVNEVNTSGPSTGYILGINIHEDMADQTHSDREGELQDTADTRVLRRRGVLTLGAGLGVTMLAGCSSQSGAPGTNGAASDTPTQGASEGTVASSTGTFRLLISDQPVAIDEFDSLTVSFDRARVFRVTDDDEETPAPSSTASETATASPMASATATETATATPTVTATEDAAASQATDSPTPSATETDTGTDTASETPPSETEDLDDDDGSRGFTIIDLEGASVDLTEVVGEKAIGVFDGELPTGRYTKIELYAADVEGIVDGETVDVKIPSGKLQIVKPFEVVAGETLSFVFDITVVKKGNGGYNLLPVISESGVAGEDVEVTEVEADGAGSQGDDDGNERDGDDEAEEADDDAPGNSGGKGKGNKQETATPTPSPTETS